MTAPSSVDDVATGLRAAGYLPGESTALVAYLAAQLGKPILVEGPAGVGKTELAKALSQLPRAARSCACSATRASTRPRRCTSGTTASSCCASRPRPGHRLAARSQDDIFGEEFLLERPLMTAIAVRGAGRPADRRDRQDRPGVRGDAARAPVATSRSRSPSSGRVEARTHPVVLLTSNNTRELTEALKRRCLYLWLDYPDARARAGDRPAARARAAATRSRASSSRSSRMVRDLDLKKPPSIAESIDWARALLLLGAQDIDGTTFPTRCRSSSSTAPTSTSSPSASASSSGRPCLMAACAHAGIAARHRSSSARSCAARASPSGRASCSTRFAVAAARSPWTDPVDFREALAATLAKSQDDRRIFELVFDRFFFRAAELAAIARGRHARRAARLGQRGDVARSNLDDAAPADRRGAARRRRGAMRDLARLAIAAFGRQGEGSGVIGVDVQRIRRALGLRAEPQPDLPTTTRAATACRATSIRRFEQMLRRELERRQIERTEQLPPARPLNELDRALPSRPAAGPRRRAPRRDAAQAPAEDAGPRDRAATSATRTSTCAARCARRWRPAACPCQLKLPADAPAAPGDLRAVRRVARSVTSASRLLPVGAARAARLVPQDALVRLHRAHQRGHRRLRARARLHGRLARRSRRDAGVADISGYTDYGRVWTRVPRPRSRTTCTRARR